MDVGASTRGRESLECGTDVVWVGGGREMRLPRVVRTRPAHTRPRPPVSDSTEQTTPNGTDQRAGTHQASPASTTQACHRFCEGGCRFGTGAHQPQPVCSKVEKPPGGGPRRRAHARAHTIQPRPTPQHGCSHMGASSVFGAVLEVTVARHHPTGRPGDAGSLSWRDVWTGGLRSTGWEAAPCRRDGVWESLRVDLRS
jgi:hypothetical protein